MILEADIDGDGQVILFFPSESLGLVYSSYSEHLFRLTSMNFIRWWSLTDMAHTFYIKIYSFIK